MNIDQNKLHQYIHRECGTIVNEKHLFDIERIVIKQNGEQWKRAWLFGLIALAIIYIIQLTCAKIEANDKDKTIKRLQTRVSYTDAIIDYQHKQIAKASIYIATNYPIQVTIAPRTKLR